MTTLSALAISALLCLVMLPCFICNHFDASASERDAMAQSIDATIAQKVEELVAAEREAMKKTIAQRVTAERAKGKKQSP